MRMVVYMPSSEFDLIEPHIDCEGWSNPEEDLYIFWNPTNKFRMLLALYSIPVTIEE
jgi:hypothetical protein